MTNERFGLVSGLHESRLCISLDLMTRFVVATYCLCFPLEPHTIESGWSREGEGRIVRVVRSKQALSGQIVKF